MSVKENKAIMRRFIEAYNDRNLDVFEELVAANFIDHTHQQHAREKFKKLFTMAFEGFPDWYEERARGSALSFLWLKIHV